MERVFNIDDHLTEAEVATLADATVLGDFSNIDNSIRKHVAECDQCAHEVAMVAQLSEGIQMVSHQHKSNAAIFKIAAWGVAAGLAIFITLRFLGPQSAENHVQVAQTVQGDSVKPVNDESIVKVEHTSIQNEKQEIKTGEENKVNNTNESSNNEKDALLLAYAPNPDIEKLVDRFNGAMLRGETIEIVSPSLIEGKFSDIKLEWKNQEEQILIVEIFNNLGQKVQELETTASSFKPQSVKKPGLYYWKLINQDFDLLFCGKIIVK